MPKEVWKDEYYVEAYALVRDGATKKRAAALLGVPLSTFKSWMANNPAFKAAILKAKKDRGGQGTDLAPADDTFNHVYKTISPELKETWTLIVGDGDHDEPDSMTEERVTELLENGGKLFKQQLFLHAYTHYNFNKSEACRRCRVTKATFDGWMKDPQFRELVNKEMRWHQQNFVEGSLMRLVAMGNPAATIFANKALNSDRGYMPEKKATLTIEGQVEHSRVVTIEELKGLSLEDKKKLLEATRQERITRNTVAALEGKA